MLIIETEKTVVGSGSRTKEGLVDSLTITVSVIIKNFSNGKMTLQNTRTRLDVPEGYNCLQFHTSIKTQEDLNSKDFISRVAQFHVSINGREGGVGSQNLVWETNKNKIISEINLAKFIFHIQAESVALEGISKIEQSFDITQEILPILKIG